MIRFVNLKRENSLNRVDKAHNQGKWRRWRDLNPDHSLTNNFSIEA